MRNIYLLFAVFWTVNVLAQSPDKNESIKTSSEKYIIQYDPQVLRIPDETLPIGIIKILTNGDTIKTKGFLDGTKSWNKYKLEIEGGRYSNGKIKIESSQGYKKDDSLLVRVYTRKWFLGKKDRFLFVEKIPYNYEKKICLFTEENKIKAPGNVVDFGIRIYFDNNKFVDKESSKSKNNLEGFKLSMEGGILSKTKSNFTIYNDPSMINNHKVKLSAILEKEHSISDTLPIILNYKDNYKCNILSSKHGHELKVEADIYFDTIINEKLMSIKVADIDKNEIYSYLVNVNGGSITISSKGSNGDDGRKGFDGSDGLSGSSGSFHVVTNTEYDSTSVITSHETVQDAGGDGSNGSDGSIGGNGDDGYDGGDVFISYTAAAEPYLSLIKALSMPGKGGDGGNGGKGGRGGYGGDGNPRGNNGMDGSDGMSGFKGTNGKAGKVVFILVSN